MTDPGRLYLDQHLAVFGSVELNLLDVERLTGLESDSSACLHDLLPGSGLTQTDFDATALIAFATIDDKSRGASSVATTTTKELPELHCILAPGVGLENGR